MEKMFTAVAACPDYEAEHVEAALIRILEKTHGLDAIKPGMRVGIKMNLVAPMKPDTAATVHPAVLSAVAKLVSQRGATPVIGDSPGGLFTEGAMNAAYRIAGVTACEAAGAELNRDCSVTDVKFPEAVQAKQFTTTEWLLKCDCIINVCKLKSHGMMGMSAAVKNLFGTIPGTVKPEYHYRYPNQKDFADMLIDLNEYFKPVICIVDAVIGMEGNGPTGGTPRKIGCLAASTSPYALDLVLANLIGLTADDVPTMKAAFDRGLAPLTAAEVAVDADVPFESLKVKDFIRSGSTSDLRFVQTGKFVSKFLGLLLTSKPACTKAECVGCGKCASICPAKAITMVEKRPKIDRKKCIRCFCCQEFCPVSAMKVHRTAIARLLVHEKGGK